jgi:hypothetical protein
MSTLGVTMQRATPLILILAMLLGGPIAWAFPPCCTGGDTTGQPVLVSAEDARDDCCRSEDPAKPDPENPTRPTHPADDHSAPGDCGCPPLCCASVLSPALSGEAAEPPRPTSWGGTLNATPADLIGRLATQDLTRPPRR